MLRIAAAATLAALATPTLAQQSHFRLYDQGTGLDAGEVGALAQDDAGFLWLGTHRGLVRFDGHEFLPFATARLDGLVVELVHGPRDELIAATQDGHAWRKAADTLEPLPGPDGGAVENLGSLDFDRSGALWVVAARKLWRRDAGGWRPVDGVPGDETPRIVRAVGAGMIVLTDKAAWRFGDGATPRRLLARTGLWRVAGSEDVLWLGRHLDGGVWRVDADGVREIASPTSRLIDMRMRGDTLWLAYDAQVVAIERDGRQRHIAVADGLPSGGPLLLDAEGSLWVGTFVGLVQFPEPDTWQWSLREGLPWPHAYGVASGAGAIWAITWGGMARIDPASGELSRLDDDVHDICVFDDGDVWATRGERLVRWQDGRMQDAGSLPALADPSIRSCARDADGARWFVVDAQLLRLSDGERVARRMAGLPVQLVWRDGDRLRAALDDRICRLATVPGAVRFEDCSARDRPSRWTTHVLTGRDTDWLGAEQDGVHALQGDVLRKLPGSVQSEGGVAGWLSPGADGSAWLSGPGVLARAIDCGECAAGLAVLERPGLWQGLPGNAAVATLETPDGDLWLAGTRGIWRVPRRVRGGAHPPPLLVPVHARVDGQTRDPTTPLRLEAHQRDLELDFAALSYRDRSLLRYRTRFDGGDWSLPGRGAQVQFPQLAPGRHRAEMAASLDGEHWSEPAVVDFSVAPMWHETAWSRAAFAALLAAVLGWLYHMRVTNLLRVQRERARIAMDLHDEIGAGLGSIGVLASAAKRARAPEDTAHIVQKIADTSALLGSGLRSLVFSLRSGDAGLADLGRQIADHARRLFPDAAPLLSLQLPDAADAAALAPDVRRHVLLFALEAMHNVARHAHARRIAVALRRDADGRIALTVEDDGGGFDPAAATAGTGLESMRRRAQAIGAAFEIDSVPGAGTRVVLRAPA